MKTIRHISSIKTRERIGNKARSLNYLSRQKFNIPATWVIPVQAWLRYQEDPEGLLAKLRNELLEILPPDTRFAVRSSAEKEDLSGFSYAGQFKSLLNLENVDQVLDGIVQVWKSGDEVLGSQYDRQAHKEGSPSGMGVILQKMVDVQWAGVAFSINPVTGRDEIIVEGILGKGGLLVQEGREPCRWVFCQGAWEHPENDSSPGEEVLEELLSGIVKLRKKWHDEVDVEWAYDGKEVFYLQSRIVTTRSYPTVYSNHISREFLPGMIKPLVWSVNIPLVNGAWIRLLEGMLGHLDIKPDQLSRAFYYRAYFNMGTMGYLFRLMGLPARSLEHLMGRKDPSGKSPFKPGWKTFRYLPRMILFLISNLWLGKKFMQWNKRARIESTQIRRTLSEDFNPEKFNLLFDRIMEHTREAAYFNIMIPLVMQLSNRLFHRHLEKNGRSPDLFDFNRDFPELREYDPHDSIRTLHQLYRGLQEETRKAIQSVEDLLGMDGDQNLLQLQSGFVDLMERFGHFSESGNDFSYPHWLEDGDFVLKMVFDAEPSDRDEVRDDPDRVSKRMRGKTGRLYRRAGKYRVYREMISSEFTREYGLFRTLFQQSGIHLTGRGVLDHPDDIFYLTMNELSALMNDPHPDQNGSILDKVRRIRQEMIDLKEVELPSVIYGDIPPPLSRKSKELMHGIPTSPGYFQGNIIVVKGYQDFHKPVEGSILVIPFADVGWTPLLARAGAIVSESGGMLSHAAIVARELSIPSISSVDHACTLEDGQVAIVDGNNGILVINQ